MSYQSIEAQDGIVGTSIENQDSRKKYLIVVLACLMSGLSIIALSGRSQSSSTLTTGLTAIKNIQRPSFSELSDKEKSGLFHEFKSKFGREYESISEEQQRFNHFKRFLSTIDERNAIETAAGSSAIHGITKFADWSATEFQSYLGFQPASKAASRSRVTRGEAPATAQVADSAKVVNWAGKYTTAVKDQGYCGSCWAFSAASQLESDAIRLGLITTNDPLSEQQLVSCDSNDFGCDGGIPVDAYEYIMKTGGLEYNATYPYTSYWGETGNCSSVSSDYVVTLTDAYYLSSEAEMARYVQHTGPLSVCLDASSWSSYQSGVLSVCGTEVDHCVQAVGINLEAAETYWVVRNSWGEDWGIDGYIYVKEGVNMCDITYLPTFVVPALVEPTP